MRKNANLPWNKEYFGHIFSKNGIRPDPKKIERIKNAKTPQNVKELQSWLGMVNYCSSFIKNMSSLA